MSKAIKTQYGLKNGQIICIWDVEECDRGLKCDCKCPHCGMDLQARLGNGKRQPHFSHNNANCDPAIAQQTALHILAKEIIEKEKSVMFPPYEVDFSETKIFFELSPQEQKRFQQEIPKNKPFREEQHVVFDSVILEKKVSTIVPDIIVEKNGHQCLIEIGITHFVEEEKRKKVVELGLPMIEIDLSDSMNSKIDKCVLTDIIKTKTENKKWITNPKYYESAKEVSEKYYKAKIFEIKEREERRLQEFIKQQKLWVIKQKEAPQKIKWALQPNNYRAILLNLRNNEAFQDVYRKTLMYEKEKNHPFFLDLPIKGEFVFKCDRRIWQTIVFEKFVYTREDLWFMGERIWLDRIISWIVSNQKEFLIDYDYAHLCYVNRKRYDLVSDVIREYLKCLEKLGFIDLLYETSGLVYVDVRSSHSLIPPNNMYASILQEKINTVDTFSVDAQDILLCNVFKEINESQHDGV